MTDIKITKNTSIPLGLVLLIIASAVAYGVLKSDVQNNGEEIAALRNDFSEFKDLFIDRNLTLK